MHQVGFRGRAAASGLLLLLAAVISAPAAAIETLAREAILVDATTGAVLFEKNADTPMPPASMSKIMTVYLLFTKLRDGKVKLDDTLPVSEHAWRTGGCVSDGSTMCLKLDERAKVEDLIRGIIIQSGNDACLVVAEGVAGSEAAYVAEMNKLAREIGLKDSVFKNTTGLPAEGHVMTVRDLTVLAKRLITDFPQYYPYYSEKSFTYNGIRQGNRNPLLYKNIGADGLKTGHTKAAGYGLTASARQGDRRLILVVTGLPSMQARAEESERLMDYGFRSFENVTLAKAGETVETAQVWLGAADTVPLQLPSDVVVTVPREGRANMQMSVVYDGPVPAPIVMGARIGSLDVTAPGIPPVSYPLEAGADVAKLGFFGRAMAALGSLVDRAVN